MTSEARNTHIPNFPLGMWVAVGAEIACALELK